MWENCRQQAFHLREQVHSIYDSLFGAYSIWTKQEKIQNAVMALGVTSFFAFFFYRSIWIIPGMIPIGICYLLIRREEDEGRQRHMLRTQFKDAILSIAANLKAGYAIENAIRESLQEMNLLYGANGKIVTYLTEMTRGINNNISVEKLMLRFADQAKLEEIEEFADTFSIARRSGGNLSEIITETAMIIGEKIEVENEIRVMITAKQYELKIMNVVPFAIVLYISATSPGFFDALYHNPTGIMIMTGCLALYLMAFLLGRKIIRIEV